MKGNGDRGHRRASRLVNTASTSNCKRRRSRSSCSGSSSTAGRSKRELVSNSNRSLRLQTQRVNIFCSYSFPSYIGLIQCHANVHPLILRPATISNRNFIQNGWNVWGGQVLRRRGKAPFRASCTVPSPFRLRSIFYSQRNNQSLTTNP